MERSEILKHVSALTQLNELDLSDAIRHEMEVITKASIFEDSDGDFKPYAERNELRLIRAHAKNLIALIDLVELLPVSEQYRVVYEPKE